jgi:hypothetical protein
MHAVQYLKTMKIGVHRPATPFELTRRLDPFELTPASQIRLLNGRYKFVVSRSKIETKVTRICYP